MSRLAFPMNSKLAVNRRQLDVLSMHPKRRADRLRHPLPTARDGARIIRHNFERTRCRIIAG
jgi:hypothetical protein